MKANESFIGLFFIAAFFIPGNRLTHFNYPYSDFLGVQLCFSRTFLYCLLYKKLINSLVNFILIYYYIFSPGNPEIALEARLFGFGLVDH